MGDFNAPPSMSGLLAELASRVALLERLQSQIPGRVVRGLVNGDGSIAEGLGFTITHNGTGDYTITFTPTFNDIPAVVALGRGVSPAPIIRHIAAATASTARIGIKAEAGAAVDGEFHFIAIGP